MTMLTRKNGARQVTAVGQVSVYEIKYLRNKKGVVTAIQRTEVRRGLIQTYADCAAAIRNRGVV